MTKQITAYEAQHRGYKEWKADEYEKRVLYNRIDILEEQIRKLTVKKHVINLSIKPATFSCTMEFLCKFLTAVQPISDVVQAEWSRKTEKE